MEKRRLGTTSLEVGIIGFGTGYLYKKSRESMVELVVHALDHGVDYFDNWIPYPEAREALSIVFKGRRSQISVAGHLGVFMNGRQSDVTRDPVLAKRYFEGMLQEMTMDYVDVLMLHNVDTQEDYDRVMQGGLLECALRLKEEGKARYIGLSGHESSTLVQAAQSGQVQVIMSPVCIAWDPKGVTEACASNNVGVVAMKPFWGGELLQAPYSDEVTPVAALGYSLAQPAVATVVPGYYSLSDLHQSLRYLTASVAERSFESAVARFGRNTLGTCVYCGHCSPCSAGIEIGEVMSMLRSIQRKSPYAVDRYAALKVRASECTECGECLGRCPQKVGIIENMREAKRLFE